MVFRVRELLIRQGTQASNALRGHRTEFGHTVPQGAANASKLIAIVEDPESGLPAGAILTREVLIAALAQSEAGIGKLDTEAMAANGLMSGAAGGGKTKAGVKGTSLRENLQTADLAVPMARRQAPRPLAPANLLSGAAEEHDPSIPSVLRNRACTSIPRPDPSPLSREKPGAQAGPTTLNPPSTPECDKRRDRQRLPLPLAGATSRQAKPARQSGPIGRLPCPICAA